MEIKKSAYREYAHAHNMIVIAFLEERYSGEIFGVTIKKEKKYNGKAYFTFGRLYHVFGNDFCFDQCGCYSTEDETEVRRHAYEFFGIR